MRIAQISTLSAPVREETTGSVEALIWLLGNELINRGHEVTVFGTADSVVRGNLIATQPGAYGTNGAIDDWQLCEWLNLCRAVERSSDFDVLHSHAYLWSLPVAPLARSPMVHTTHIVPDANTAKLWRTYPNAHVTAVSHSQWSEFPTLKPRAVIHHGVDVSRFTLNAQPADYVCYLGRFSSGKGPRHAIATAKALGIRLLMAGPPSAYFREQVQPLIDGKSVEYVGFLKGAERDKLLGGAKALLYPIQYAESFGLVLVEAMLCGTPVAALRIGAVAEIIDEAVTGYSVTRVDELREAVTRCFALDRGSIRQRAAERFSIQIMAKQYEQFYATLAAGSGETP